MRAIADLEPQRIGEPVVVAFDGPEMQQPPLGDRREGTPRWNSGPARDVVRWGRASDGIDRPRDSSSGSDHGGRSSARFPGTVTRARHFDADSLVESRPQLPRRYCESDVPGSISFAPAPGDVITGRATRDDGYRLPTASAFALSPQSPCQRRR